jgi:cell division protease FtsH
MRNATSRPAEAPEEHPSSPWRVEGAPPPKRKRGLRGWRPPGGRRFWLVVALLLAVNWYVAAQIAHRPRRVSVPYTFFVQQVKAGQVLDVTSREAVIQGDFRVPVRYPPGSTKAPVTRFQTTRPSFAQDDLLTLLTRERVTVDARSPDAPRPIWLVLVTSILPTLLIVGLVLVIARSMGGLRTLGRSRARLYDASEHRTNFDDVAGIEEAQDELVEIVSFLSDPDRYRRLGAEIPRGVLLSGPPGTGKTLLARAVAGEADVPFYSLSASEFIEMVVGVGASRVRDLFNQAKQSAPAIIFVDELDAIGRARGGAGARVGGGHDEREQTLNQILVEMDGFSGTEGVIVLAATNRPEILDPALLRPGRFDRHVTVNPPDQAGRRRILSVHTRRVPLAAGVDLAQIASATPGMVGADLKNLVNEAALAAARRGAHHVEPADFETALEKVVLGAERRITISPSERERTAYHEAGHAVLGMLEPGADPVRRVSIVPRGRSLGSTFQSPDSDRHAYDADYLRGRIIGALGGRAAEELVYGNVTSGAESDLEQVTRIARQMVGRWGMSKAVGLMSVLSGPGDDADPANGGASEATRELVDLEARRIIAECYEMALGRLRDNRARLEALAAALLDHETLDEEAAYRAAGFDHNLRTEATEPAGASSANGGSQASAPKGAHVTG